VDKRPFISVVVCVFNGERTIGQCLESVLNQTYPRERFEVVVVDDASTDSTPEIIKRYADKIITHKKNLKRGGAHLSGIKTTKGEIIVSVDSDVLANTDTLAMISEYLMEHPEVSAVTGQLSERCPHNDFFSRYKNVYMNYIFSRLPERVSFIFNSISAIRKEVGALYTDEYDIGEDTAFGQRLTNNNKQIAFLKDLRVTHLKEYSFASFVKNNFLVPYHWAVIFMRFKGWRQFGRNKTGFAHAPGHQIFSVLLAPAMILSILLTLFFNSFIVFSLVLVIAWTVLNAAFFAFIIRKKGFLFALPSVFVTAFDNCVMFSGILCGILSWIKRYFFQS